MNDAAQEPFGTRLRRLREARGLKVTSLAMRVGLTEAAIHQLESGRTREPRLTDGMRLADKLGADARYLAFGEGEDLGSEMERRLTILEQRLGDPSRTRRFARPFSQGCLTTGVARRA